MAVDDVTTIITANMAQGDTTDRQPGSGVEEMLLAVGDTDTAGAVPDNAPSIMAKLIDGTNNNTKWFNNATSGQAARTQHGKFMSTNTNYLRIEHQGASTDDYGFAVIQVG